MLLTHGIVIEISICFICKRMFLYVHLNFFGFNI
jgi:hypothetical protein